MDRDANRSERLRDAGQKVDFANRLVHPDLRDEEKTGGLVRQVHLADASAGQGADRSDDRPKEAGRDCRWAEVLGFRSATGRDCQSSASVAVAGLQDENVLRQRGEPRQVGHEIVGREQLAAERADADRGHLGRVDPGRDVKAVRAVH